jgi:hypothetical protein
MKTRTVHWALVSLILILTSCAYLGKPGDPAVRNLSLETVLIYQIDEAAGIDQLIVTLEPQIDQLIPFEFQSDHCSGSPLEARSADGAVIERRDRPICQDDVWRIGDE